MITIQKAKTTDISVIKKLDKFVFNDSILVDYGKMHVRVAVSQIAAKKKVLGFIAYHYKTIANIKYIYISTLLVHPSHQNQGIGTRLLKDLLSRTSIPIILYVDKNSNHDKLVKFYKSFKFKLFGKSPTGNTRMLKKGVS